MIHWLPPARARRFRTSCGIAIAELAPDDYPGATDVQTTADKSEVTCQKCKMTLIWKEE